MGNTAGERSRRVQSQLGLNFNLKKIIPDKNIYTTMEIKEVHWLRIFANNLFLIFNLWNWNPMVSISLVMNC